MTKTAGWAVAIAATLLLAPALGGCADTDEPGLTGAGRPAAASAASAGVSPAPRPATALGSPGSSLPSSSEASAVPGTSATTPPAAAVPGGGAARRGPAAWSSVPDPGPTGSVTLVVPGRPVASLPPVSLGTAAAPALGVSAAVVRARAVQGRASVPGEVRGPAVELTVVVRNTSDDAIRLDDVVVTVFGSSGAPAPPTSAASTTPLEGRLAPGARATGTYAATLAPDDRDPVVVVVSLAPDLPDVVAQVDMS